MKWVKRGLWTAAWAFWLWLGFGLHRELPRGVGPTISKMAFSESESPLGFVHGERLLVTQVAEPNEDRHLATWDVASGMACRHRPFEYHEFKASLRHGVAIGVAVKPNGEPQKSMQMVDLRTGVFVELGDKSWRVLAIHPTKLHAAFAVPVGTAMSQKLVILDLQTREPVFEWKNEPLVQGNRSMIRECQFLDDSDGILLVRLRIDSALKSGSRDELLVYAPNAGIKFVPITRPEARVHLPIQSGRLALHYALNGDWQADIVEVPSGRTAFASASIPRQNGIPSEHEWNSAPQLGPSGRTMVSHRWNLWSVEQRRPLWTPSDIDEWVLHGSQATLDVLENWKPMLRILGVSRDFKTRAVRDIESGALKHRSWDEPQLACVDADERMAAFRDGTVREIPFRVNFPLLALCQSILALPLLLLWAILRWRRNRRLLLAGVQP